MAYDFKLLKKETVARDTMAFYWEKPEGFEYRAGQFGDMTILNPPETDDEGNMRGFSLVSAPFEKDLVTATRMRDTAFKRVLKNLPEGTVVKFDGPYGNFTLHKTETTPAVFIIGGIGVTPVRSMIAEATHDQLPHEITLIYANRTKEDAAFIDDFEKFAKENPHFTFVPVMTNESGHVNEDLLKKYVSDFSKPIYYLSGPAGMVKSMRETIIKAGANEDNIKTEEFSGY